MCVRTTISLDAIFVLAFKAGEKHYHPECSRCARCHGVFGEGQEMFLQGKVIKYSMKKMH